MSETETAPGSAAEANAPAAVPQEAQEATAATPASESTEPTKAPESPAGTSEPAEPTSSGEAAANQTAANTVQAQADPSRRSLMHYPVRLPNGRKGTIAAIRRDEDGEITAMQVQVGDSPDQVTDWFHPASLQPASLDDGED